MILKTISEFSPTSQVFCKMLRIGGHWQSNPCPEEVVHNEIASLLNRSFVFLLEVLNISRTKATGLDQGLRFEVVNNKPKKHSRTFEENYQ